MTIDSYIICTSPRCGSTLLCRLLRQTGVAGYPESYFHDSSLDAWLAAFDLPRNVANSERDVLVRVFQAAVAEGSRDSGVFGLRLQRHSFAFFAEKLAVLHPGLASDYQRIAASFGRTAFILLTRNDKLGQAISYVKAEQSGLWHMLSNGTELERLSAPREPSYDAEELQRRIEQFAIDEVAWNDWFEQQRIAPLRLTYEMLSQDAHESIGRVLDHLGLDRAAAVGAAPDVMKLADDKSREWAHRFRREHGC